MSLDGDKEYNDAFLNWKVQEYSLLLKFEEKFYLETGLKLKEIGCLLNGRKVENIKKIKAEFGLGLKDAKMVSDYIDGYYFIKPPSKIFVVCEFRIDFMDYFQFLYASEQPDFDGELFYEYTAYDHCGELVKQVCFMDKKTAMEMLIGPYEEIEIDNPEGPIYRLPQILLEQVIQ